MSTLIASRPVRKVALTCDFLRVQPGTKGFDNFQPRNLAWLQRIIGAKDTWERWGVESSVITAPTEPEAFRRSLGNDTIFSSYLNNADQTWASLYDAKEFTVFRSIFDDLCQHDLIVGFELPPTLKRALHQAGKQYISFYIHPVRFLRDLCLLVTTNSHDVADLIAQKEIASNEIDSQVKRFSALFSRLQLPSLALPNNVPVLIGQTEKDSVLIRDERFTSWKDHEDTLAKMLEPYREVIFLEHPYCQNSALVTEYLRGTHGKTVISLRINSYGVIFSPLQTPFFLTLASSLGVEARCAKRDCTFLHGDPSEQFILSGVDIPDAGMVSHAVLQDDFWKNIFSGDYIKKKSKTGTAATANDFPLGDHYLRNSLDSWAFRPLQSGINIDPVRKLILPASVATQESLATLNAILCAESISASKKLIDCGRVELAWGSVETLAKPFILGGLSAFNLSQSQASHYLIEGFNTPENWGVWSSGKYAKLVLPINLAGSAEVELEISMVVKVYSGIIAHAPVLQITVEGHEVGFVLFRKSAKNEQQIHFTCRVKNPACQIEFRVSHAGAPALFEQSLDHRELGFGICALDVAVSLITAEKQYDQDIDDHTEKIEGFWGASVNTYIDKDASPPVEGGTA